MRLADCLVDEQVSSAASSYSAVVGTVQLTMGIKTLRIRILNLDKAFTSISLSILFHLWSLAKVKRRGRQSMLLSLIAANESLLDVCGKQPLQS